MADKIRIGIIGLGHIGQQHLRDYSNIPEAEIVAVTDIRADVAERVACDYGIPSVYTEYQEMLNRDDIQSVDVCLHNRLHAPVTIAALQAGKNVYCEKPMSWVYGEAKAMYTIARELGRQLHIQLSTIYTPEARAAKRLINDGLLGEIYYAKSSHYLRRGRPFVDGYGSAQFVNTATAGGGALVDMAVYYIARILWLLDNPDLISVSGVTYQKLDNMYEDRRVSSKYNVEEMGIGLVRLKGGITYFVEEAWSIHNELPDGERIFGSHGGLRVDPLGYFTTMSDMEMNGVFDLNQADWRWHQCNPLEVGYDDSQRHWIWAQLGRVPLLDTAGIALKASMIAEGIYLSQHLGREVTAEEIEMTPIGFGREGIGYASGEPDNE